MLNLGAELTVYGAHGLLVVHVGEDVSGEREDDGVVDDEGVGGEEVSSLAGQSLGCAVQGSLIGWISQPMAGGKRRSFPAPRSSSGDSREAKKAWGNISSLLCHQSHVDNSSDEATSLR